MGRDISVVRQAVAKIARNSKRECADSDNRHPRVATSIGIDTAIPDLGRRSWAAVALPRTDCFEASTK